MSNRKPKSPHWRCLECGMEGDGGTSAFTHHWITTHNEEVAF